MLDNKNLDSLYVIVHKGDNFSYVYGAYYIFDWKLKAKFSHLGLLYKHYWTIRLSYLGLSFFYDGTYRLFCYFWMRWLYLYLRYVNVGNYLLRNLED